jgi:hypothetical protein
MSDSVWQQILAEVCKALPLSAAALQARALG